MKISSLTVDALVVAWPVHAVDGFPQATSQFVSSMTKKTRMAWNLTLIVRITITWIMLRFPITYVTSRDLQTLPDGKKPTDDDFQFDGYADLNIPDNEEEDNAKYQDSEYGNTITGRKRKRTRSGTMKAATPSLQRSAITPEANNVEAFILDEDGESISKPSSRIPGTFGRRNRRKAESLPAYHKRVSHPTGF